MAYTGPILFPPYNSDTNQWSKNVVQWGNRKTPEIVSLSDFGAIGDGTTDNTAAIQAGLDNLSPGTILKFYATGGGNFLIYGPLTCSTNDILILGPNANTAFACCLIAAGANGYTMLTLSGDEQVVWGLGFLANPSLLVGGLGATRTCIAFTGDANANMDATVSQCTFGYAAANITTTGRNINIYDNLFSNSKIGVQVQTATTGATRDFVIQRNRFHNMGAVKGTDFCIDLSGSGIFETQIIGNFLDGQSPASLVDGVSDEMLILDNRISIPTYQWMNVKGNILKISNNVCEGNGTGATGVGITVYGGSDVTITENTCINAPYQAINVTGVNRFSIKGNHIANASNATSNTYDAISVGNTSSNGAIDENNIINTSTGFCNHGIAGDPSNSTAFGNKFINCALSNINSSTLYNTTPTANGARVEGTNGVMKDSGAKYYSFTTSASGDVANVTFDSTYGACILDINLSLYGASGANLYAVMKRYIAFTAGVPIVTTIGTDATNNCAVSFTYVSSTPNILKVTVTNALAQTVRGGINIDLHGGGSNLTGAAGATLSML